MQLYSIPLGEVGTYCTEYPFLIALLNVSKSLSFTCEDHDVLKSLSFTCEDHEVSLQS